MTLSVKFHDHATGSSRRHPGDVWKAQDGPGRPWLETMVPGITKGGGLGWFVIGRDLDRSQVDAIAFIIMDATAGAETHAEALLAARQALEDRGVWDLVQAEVR